MKCGNTNVVREKNVKARAPHNKPSTVFFVKSGLHKVAPALPTNKAIEIEYIGFNLVRLGSSEKMTGVDKSDPK
jgi:hypothetical protein